MKGPIPVDILQKYQALSFNEAVIKMAWEAVNNEGEMIDKIMDIQSKSQIPDHQVLLFKNILNKGQDDDHIMNQAILDSLATNKHQQVAFEIMNPEQRKRSDLIPVGLKNVGNTCYFNSLLQTYFFNSEFVKSILRFHLDNDNDEESGRRSQKLKTSIELVLQLQGIFVSMIGSDKKYVDPTNVVKSICDDFGNHLPIGDQKDVGEFNSFFLSRIEEGLQSGQIKKSMINDQEPPSQSRILQDSSLLRQHSFALTEDSLVAKLFFGKQKQILEYKSKGKIEQNQKDEIFNFIPLDVRQGNVYDAFDSYLVNHIENYKTDHDETVAATQYNWISEPPQTLSFQIQRVSYDQQKNESVKINDAFQFEQEFYIDRFLYYNANQYLKIREQIQKIKDEQKAIRRNLNSLNQFHEKQDLNQMIDGMINFLELQQTKSDNPAYFGQKGDVKSFVQNLKLYNAQVQEKKNHFLKKDQELEAQKQASFNGLRKTKYTLQSILIHEGMANSGHYYAYIYDKSLQKWFRFNDIHVSEEKWEKIQFDSIGGNGVQNAYLLVYVRDDIHSQETKKVFRSYRISESPEYLKDFYGSFLEPTQKQEIMRENQAFREDIANYKFNLTIDSIINSYSNKFSYINEQFRAFKQKYGNNSQLKFKPQFTLDLASYIKSIDDNKNDNLIKFLIADSCVREYHPQKFGLLDDQLTEGEKLKLMNKFRASFNDFKAPKQLNLSERASYERYQNEFTSYVRFGSILLYFFNLFVDGNYQQSLFALNLLSKEVQALPNSNSYKKYADNMKQLLPLVILIKTIIKEIPYDLNLLGSTLRFLKNKYIVNIEVQCWNVQITVFLAEIYEQHPDKVQDKLNERFEQDNDTFNEFEPLLSGQNADLEQFLNLQAQEHEALNINMNKQNDQLFEGILQTFDKVKTQYKQYTAFQQQLAKSNLPLFKDQRDEIFKVK
ncbi:hypothetical protein pb186bvf_005254 [Paramecium bursaria]